MIIKNCNVNKLHDEFMQAGIYPYPVFDLGNGEGDFTFPEGTDMDLVQQKIDTHDPAPLPPKPTEKERLEALEAAMLELILGGDV